MQALAHRLERDREVAVLAGDLEQLVGPLALLPQRRAPLRIAPGEQQRTGGALAEPGREHGRAAELGGDDRLDLVRAEHREVTARWLGVGVGQADHDAVVAVHGLHVQAVAFAQPGGDRQRPRSVDRGSERRVHDQPPVAELVAEALDEHGPVIGQVSGRVTLLAQVREQVGRAPSVQTGRARTHRGVCTVHCGHLAQECTERASELDRPPGSIALPERHAADLAGGRRDEHAVVRDVLDPPRGRAQQEHVAHAGLVDHLLVQLADPSAGAFGACQEDAEQAAVGDRAAAGHREPLRPGPGVQLATDAVPHQAWTQLGERVGRVSPGQHVEHGVQGRAGQPGKRSRSLDDLGDSVDRQRLHRHHCDDLLGQHVERIAGVAHCLDEAVAHPLGHDRALDQVAAVLREDDAA